MTHIQIRLQERHIHFSESFLALLALACDVDTAYIIQRLNKRAGDRKNSNGELVYLIVRGGVPVTVMYRRESQPKTAEAIRVCKVVELVQF